MNKIKLTASIFFGFVCMMSLASCHGDDTEGAETDFSGDNSSAEAMDVITDNSSESTEWEVIFEDDFTGNSSEPDPDKWVLCTRGTDSWNRYLSESYDQAYQKDGCLYLIAEKTNGEYKTGAIETRGKFDFEYGRVECRARFLRHPKGNHTGIWMMPAPPAEQWPKSGEIDIMEHLNNEWKVYQTIHSWYADDMGHKEDPAAQAEADLDEINEWNVYGLEWDAEKIVFSVNGRTGLSYPNLHLEGEDGEWQWPFSHPFYLILSQSLGGEGTWAGEIDDDELPAIFEIDRITVMKKTNSSEDAGVPAIKAD